MHTTILSDTQLQLHVQLAAHRRTDARKAVINTYCALWHSYSHFPALTLHLPPGPSCTAFSSAFCDTLCVASDKTPYGRHCAVRAMSLMPSSLRLRMASRLSPTAPTFERKNSCSPIVKP